MKLLVSNEKERDGGCGVGKIKQRKQDGKNKGLVCRPSAQSEDADVDVRWMRREEASGWPTTRDC